MILISLKKPKFSHRTCFLYCLRNNFNKILGNEMISHAHESLHSYELLFLKYSKLNIIRIFHKKYASLRVLVKPILL